MHFNKKSNKLNRLIYSIVTLIMMLMLLFTATYSWLCNQQTASLSAGNDYISIDPESGLEMNYGHEDMTGSIIDINKVVKDDFEFHECSSLDGRRIFFPLSEYSSGGDGDFVDNVTTRDLVFRNATVSDKNSKYISVDLSLYSKNAVNVWLSNDTEITGAAASSIRMSFIENVSGGKAVLFDNSETKDWAEDRDNQTEAIAELDQYNRAGSIITQDINALQEYTFDNEDGNVLFSLEAGVEKAITVNIWLEGTDKDCANAVANLSELDIHIKFSTTSENQKTLYFIDNTLEGWVDDDECYVFAINQNGKKNPMRKSDNYDKDHTWICNVPVSTESIQFARYNPKLQENNPQEWNYWNAGTLGECTTYNALGHSAGVWKDNLKRTTITVFDGTNNGWLHGVDQAEFHVTYSMTDGNNNTVNLDYKMSYQNTVNRFSIIIPSEVKNLGFKRMNKEQTVTHNTWKNLNRGSNFYYNITADGQGYWSTRYIYINDSAGLKGDAAFGAYFHNNSTGVWTGMHSRSPSGYYVAVVPNGFDAGVVFTRYNRNSLPGWQNYYNQTPEHLEYFGGNNRFTTHSWQNNDNVIYGAWDYTSE